MLSVRDLDKILSLLRRVYHVVVDRHAGSVCEMVVAFLDART